MTTVVGGLVTGVVTGGAVVGGLVTGVDAPDEETGAT